MAISFFIKRKQPKEFKKGEGEVKKPLAKPQAQPQSKPEPVIREEKAPAGKQCYAFMDASNLFWGGGKSLGFDVDFVKLKRFLEDKFGVTKIFYYAGVRIFDFPYSYSDSLPLNLTELLAHLQKLETEPNPPEPDKLKNTISKIRFYLMLEQTGYELKIKPAKVHFDEYDENREKPILKANCDVDMTFDMMRYLEQYQSIVAMTGDGDFVSVLNYLKQKGRSLVVISRFDSTANEIKDIAGKNLFDLANFRRQIQKMWQSS